MRITPFDKCARQQLLQRGGLCEQETLARNATQLKQSGDLRLEFNAFRNRVESERFAEHDDCARQFGPIVGVGQAADEGTIDF